MHVLVSGTQSRGPLLFIHENRGDVLPGDRAISRRRCCCRLRVGCRGNYPSLLLPPACALRLCFTTRAFNPGAPMYRENAGRAVNFSRSIKRQRPMNSRRIIG